MNNLMIDLETMGTSNNAPIIAIGAVFFDLKTGDTGSEFYTEVSLESCQSIGMTPDASTIIWWMKQSEDARKKFFNNEVAETIHEALVSLSLFIEENSTSPTEVWGNGISFDLGILSNAYNSIGEVAPWNFWNERDVRTIVALDDGKTKREAPFDGVPHYAIDDCYHQIKYVVSTINKVSKQ